MISARPHDLFWITNAGALIADCAPPDWVREAISAAPVVVVRRGVHRASQTPVGVRGKSRSERFAAFVTAGDVHKRITPEDLVKVEAWKNNHRPEFAPIRRALETLAREWISLHGAWGPTGSAGFELATGIPCVTSASDLDLVIRASQRIEASRAIWLLQSVAALQVPADIRIETPFGSVALKEYAAPSPSKLLMKTSHGPKLVFDPWRNPPIDTSTGP
ncbi:MAG: malonate decarboxylase holo-ACP synthase [Terracidiphilus sp.]